MSCTNNCGIIYILRPYVIDEHVLCGFSLRERTCSHHRPQPSSQKTETKIETFSFYLHLSLILPNSFSFFISR